MAKQIAGTFLVLFGALWYSFLFWESDMGINTLLFTLFVVCILFIGQPDLRFSPTPRLMVGATLLAAFSVTWQGTFLARFIYWLSFILLIGYAQRRELRFLLFAFLLGGSSIFTAPLGAFKQWSRRSSWGQWWPAVRHWVLLAFFYRNLNFFPDNHLLKQLAYIWIAQNAVLALSVGIRNWHYLVQYGLTHRRIGVLVFLALVLYGLWTVYGKIAQRRSMFFLLQKNAWSLFVCLLLLATVNWDLVITRYNLWRPAGEGIDTIYLLRDLSHQNLYILTENRERLERYAMDQKVETDYWLGEKRRALRKRLAKRDWRGWNVVDGRGQ